MNRIISLNSPARSASTRRGCRFCSTSRSGVRTAAPRGGVAEVAALDGTAFTSGPVGFGGKALTYAQSACSSISDMCFANFGMDAIGSRSATPFLLFPSLRAREQSSNVQSTSPAGVRFAAGGQSGGPPMTFAPAHVSP